MMKSKILLVTVLLLTSFFTLELRAAYAIKNGCLMNAEEVATLSAQEHYVLGAEAIGKQEWKEAAKQFTIVTRNFPVSHYGQEAFFYLGVSLFYMEEYDFANEAFSEYLQVQSSPRFFQETIEYKFAIAEKFTAGAKRRFWGTKRLPKWASGKGMALKIYDEVITAVPCHEIAAYALISKGWVLWGMKDYRSSYESFSLVIKRFPKNELAPQCYLLIAKMFLDQSYHEGQNADILAFAEINLKKYQRDFPRDPNLEEAAQTVMEIKEVYANGLYQTGQFYERTHKYKAAIIYYYNAIHQFPDTCVAALCKERLSCIDENYLYVDEKPYGSPEIEEKMIERSDEREAIDYEEIIG